MKYAVLAVRLILGLGFTVLGLDYFLHFLDMPKPDDLPPAVTSFMSALGPTGYMKAIKVFEVTGGVLLLTGFIAPLGLVLLTPVIVNIFFYDLFLMQKPGLGYALLPMALFLIWAYRPYFASVFTLRAHPAVGR
jgi:putative oxidoreductase